MKRPTPTNFGHAAQPTLLAVGLILCVSSAMGQAPTIVNAADGSGSAAFWYLNGLPSCCEDSPGAPPNQAIYYTQWEVLANLQPGCTGTPTWSTDHGTLVSISPELGAPAAILTSLGPSYTTNQYTPVYNINIYVTACGVKSAGFPVFINTPYSFSSAVQGRFCNKTTGLCNCNAFPSTMGALGYAGSYYDSAYDLFGNVFVPIDLHEKWLNPVTFVAGNNWAQYMANNLVSYSWPASVWNSGTTWGDAIGACAPAADFGAIDPEPLPWGNVGTAATFTENQEYWIGTTTLGNYGTCVLWGGMAWFSDHDGYDLQVVPGIPATLCQ
ncbi:MAG: hypothetical protein WB579_15240 [Bryobacteraceae bacterium]